MSFAVDFLLLSGDLSQEAREEPFARLSSGSPATLPQIGDDVHFPDTVAGRPITGRVAGRKFEFDEEGALRRVSMLIRGS